MKLINTILSSNFINNGVIGKMKDYLYYNYISPRLEGNTDLYREEILSIFFDVYRDEKWILAFGSALLYYRDNTMKGQDIDIIIPFESFDKHKNQLKKYGFLLKGKYLNNEGEITEYKLIYKKIEIDIFFITKDIDSKYWIYSTFMNKKEKIKRIYKDRKRITTGEGYCSYKEKMIDFECEEYNFNNISFKSYKNMEENLKYLYGPDWRIPDSHFSRKDELENHFIIMENAYSEFYDKPTDEY